MNGARGVFLKRIFGAIRELPYPNTMKVLAFVIKGLSLNFNYRIIKMLYLLDI